MIMIIIILIIITTTTTTTTTAIIIIIIIIIIVQCYKAHASIGSVLPKDTNKIMFTTMFTKWHSLRQNRKYNNNNSEVLLGDIRSYLVYIHRPDASMIVLFHMYLYIKNNINNNNNNIIIVRSY